MLGQGSGEIRIGFLKSGKCCARDGAGTHTRSATIMSPSQIGFRCVLCLSAVPLAECRLLHCCERVPSLVFRSSQSFSRSRLL